MCVQCKDISITDFYQRTPSHQSSLYYITGGPWRRRTPPPAARLHLSLRRGEWTSLADLRPFSLPPLRSPACHFINHVSHHLRLFTEKAGLVAGLQIISVTAASHLPALMNCFVFAAGYAASLLNFSSDSHNMRINIT